MAWNFRRGRDWSTGGTPMVNHCFVDGIEGDDLNTGLDPNLPLKTITRAKFLYPVTQIIICAPARYVDQYGTIGGSGELYLVIGDSEDNDVIMEDSVGNRVGINANFTENLVLRNYLDGSYRNERLILNCTFEGCQICGINFNFGCRYINTTYSIDFNRSMVCSNCTFINTSIFFNITRQCNFSGCFFDAASTLNFVVGTVRFIASHFENKVSFDIPAVDYQASNTDGNAYTLGLNLLNYSFDPVLSPLFGRGFPDGQTNPKHLANFYLGHGFYTGIAAFDAKIAANPNLDVVANELLNIGPNDIEFLESDEVTMITPQVLGLPRKVGIINYASTVIGSVASSNILDRLIEVRYSLSDSGALPPYKLYRFGERLSENGDGTPNGSPLYSWQDNQPVFAKRFQIRVGIVKSGVI